MSYCKFWGWSVFPWNFIKFLSNHIDHTTTKNNEVQMSLLNPLSTNEGHKSIISIGDLGKIEVILHHLRQEAHNYQEIVQEKNRWGMASKL